MLQLELSHSNDVGTGNVETSNNNNISATFAAATNLLSYSSPQADTANDGTSFSLSYSHPSSGTTDISAGDTNGSSLANNNTSNHMSMP